MLDPVARDEDKATLAIERHHVDQAEALSPRPLRHGECPEAVAARKPAHERDQRDHEDEGRNESEIGVQADDRFKR